MFDVRSLFAALRRPPQPTGAFARGLGALETGRHAEALAAFDEASLGEPAIGEAEIQNKRGVALMALGRGREAVDAFCASLGADDRFAPALVNLGNVLVEDGHALDAVDYYEAAIRADDRYAPAYRNLTVALRKLGRRGEAVRAWRKAVRFGRRSGRV